MVLPLEQIHRQISGIRSQEMKEDMYRMLLKKFQKDLELVKVY
jgi:hypothetical protein